MKSFMFPGALLLAALATGCSAAVSMGGAEAPAGAGGASAGEGGFSIGPGGASGFGGSISITADAGSVTGNLSDNPPTYDWKTHTCIGCIAGGGASGSGGSAGDGGAIAFGGAASSGGFVSSAGGASSMAGALGAGGSAAMGGAPSAGGARANGGSTGTAGSGGRAVTDAGVPSPDAPGLPADASTDVPRPSDGPRPADASSPDASAPSDARQPDTSPGCKAQIVPVVPTSLPTSGNPVVAGPNTQIVLRAEIVSGGPSAGATWTWQAWSVRNPLSPTALGQKDPATAEFVIADSGQYTFTATDSTQACSATLSPGPFGDPNVVLATSPQLSFAMVNATPPPAAKTPAQLGSVQLGAMSSGTIQTNIGLLPGVPVQISPSIGSNIVTSYVRISHFNQSSNELELVADGEEQAQTGQGPAAAAFSTQLLGTNLGGNVLRYDVLVAPLDGSGTDGSPGGTVDATAPQLFRNLAASDFNGSTFGLAGGVKVTGTATSTTGPVKDVRVVLTSQDPTAPLPDPSIPLLFSSVGQSLADGTYKLNVQPSDYWVSVSPPEGTGLAEALAPDPVTINGSTTIDFQWDTPSTADLNLTVVDADGTPVSGARVRATSSLSQKVGTLSVQNAGGALPPKNIFSKVQIEDTTSSTGSVTFAKLPAGSTYDLLLVPATLGPRSTTTTVLAVAVPTGGTTQTVHLQAKATINGQLVAPQGDAGPKALDFSTVTVRAYDQTADSPEASSSTLASADGSFSLGVTPGRSYVVLAMPPTNSGAARTFVGPGPMQASEFTVTQRLMPSIAWTGKVALAGTSTGIPGTALQILCQASWPYCFDPTVPLAETTTDANGAFQFALADQTKR